MKSSQIESWARIVGSLLLVIPFVWSGAYILSPHVRDCGVFFAIGIHSKDLACQAIECITYYPGAERCSYNVVNLTQQKIDADARVAREAALEIGEQEQESKRKECYNKGHDVNYTLDLIKDYNLSCEKIGYLNDHLLLSNSKESAGQISGDYAGFVSYGNIRGDIYQYVYAQNLATGQLLKSYSAHLDCNNQTLYWEQTPNDYSCDEYGCRLEQRDTKKETYYVEKDFVLYYTSHCTGDKK